MSLTAEQQAERAKDRASEATITEVHEWEDSWNITLDSHTGFVLGKENLGDREPPAKGDGLTLYTRGLSWIKGVDLRGEPLYYKTDQEMDEEHRKGVEARKKERQLEFEEKREEYDAQFDSLPEVFQRRVQWFRDHHEDFRWEFEPYELSSCLDAVRIAEALETPERITDYSTASNKRQKELVPDVDYGAHSGNSFGMAVRLAFLYVTDPLLVVAEHGAMTPLTGCEEYGCHHPREQDVLDAVAAYDPPKEDD